ncbi:MAG: ABC transporter ATP-binding protein [Rubrobacteraceae bacterium]|nr:ABC transporter ATP-binding protein [Rubrobacteraceae bacterium]
MATLSLHKVRKEFGKTVALAGLDLEVRDGEFFVLLGPSGAGKTTTLKCIAGLEEPTAGRVEIGGVDMTDVEPYDRGVAMAFENYALYPQMTVMENMMSPLRSKRYRVPQAEARERVQKAADTLGIGHLMERFPRELSNGQRQRVALGRVLVRPADVLLLDEPLSHLDAKLQMEMRAELKSLGEMQSTTSLYVTHDYREALALGERVGILREGVLLQVGTGEEIWKRPADSFVARALGQPEINLISGAVVESSGGKVFRSEDSQIELPLSGAQEVTSGYEVELGMRPIDLEISSGEAPPGNLTLRGRVYVVERLGREFEITVSVGKNQVVVVTNRGEVGLDDLVEISLPPSKLHLFDKRSGRRIEMRQNMGAAKRG